jgi:hypothetical protein
MSIVLIPCVLQSRYLFVFPRSALVLHCPPLYYKRPTYYCYGSVVKSPVLYLSPSRLNSVLCSLIRAAVSWVAIKNYFLSKASACILSRSKSRTHRLDGDSSLAFAVLLGSVCVWQQV